MFALLRRVAAISLVLAFTVIAAAPGQVWAGGNISPRTMLIQYYSTINARQYQVAYQQWVNPPQTYQNFAAGYANTASATGYFGGFQPGAPGSTDGRVPGILVGVDFTGSPSVYYGCYDVRYNDTATGLAQWTITGANFTQVSHEAATGANYIFPRTDCYNLNANQLGGIGDLPPAVSAEQMLVRYFTAVNAQAYDIAYPFWANPQQTYQQFVSGWADTSETVLFYGSYQPFRGTYATYETGRVPVVLMGYHTDGSLVAYQGCIGVNYTATRAQPWGLWASYVRAMPFTMTPAKVSITQALSASCY